MVCPSYFRTRLIENMQGTDTAVGQVIGGLVAAAPLGPDEIAAAVLEGMDRGDELILPDEAARAAYELKLADRPAYDQLMRKQAARLARDGQQGRSPAVTEIAGAAEVRDEDRFDVDAVRAWLAERGTELAADDVRCGSSGAAPPT